MASSRTIAWEISKEEGSLWKLAIVPNKYSAIVHDFYNGGSGARNLRPGRYAIKDNKLNINIIVLKEPNILGYTTNEGFVNFIIKPELFRSLKEYIIDITPSTTQHNTLKEARYSIEDDMLHIMPDEDPMAPVRNEDNPYNFYHHAQEEPTNNMEGGRRIKRGTLPWAGRGKGRGRRLTRRR